MLLAAFLRAIKGPLAILPREQDLSCTHIHTGTMSTTTSPTDYPYCCHVDVAFPTAQHAQQTMRVMQVDEEIGERVQKSFALLKNNDNDNNEQTIVRM